MSMMPPPMTRDDVLERVREAMVELFELAPDDVHPTAHLIDDLDLDSIDAIDMAARLQEMTGRRVPEERLKSLRTVADVVDLVYDQLTARSADELRSSPPARRPA